MQLNNREWLKEFNIPVDWYMYREPGISAMLRVGNEEQWIGPCLESILPFFDEIVITIDCTDKTKKIIQTFDSPKIKMYDYPFYIGPVNGVSNRDSVHDKSYYYNWSLAKTTKQIVSKWDADMLMLPKLYGLKEKILSKNIVNLYGYNIVNINPLRKSKVEPIEHKEPRFFHVNKYLYYDQPTQHEKYTYWKDTPIPMSKLEVFTFERGGLPKIFSRPTAWLYTPPYLHYWRLSNIFIQKDITIKEPMYLHTKWIKKDDNLNIFSEEQLRRKEQGDVLEIDRPKYLDKVPEDYLNA